MHLSNDARGWAMTSISAVACVLGASIICVDVVVRQFPGKKNFRIQDSDVFLSSSLSLSFGVMLFSALYKMLPTAKNSLHEGGLSPKTASWVLIACFTAGAIGIYLLSRVLHQYLPSHAVDCNHTHDEEGQKTHHHDHSDSSSSDGKANSKKRRPHSRNKPWPSATPQETRQDYFTCSSVHQDSAPADEVVGNDNLPTTITGRPTLRTKISRTLSKLSTVPSDGCPGESEGQCHGFTDPCGQECFRIVQTRGSFSSDAPPRNILKTASKPNIEGRKMPSGPLHRRPAESTPLLAEVAESDSSGQADLMPLPPGGEVLTESERHGLKRISDSSTLTPYDHAVLRGHKNSTVTPQSTGDTQTKHHHHHHVPQNAFLTIGLQTSIAIALHKLPEGFITYATNHANPKLGFSVFLALFIHNITEGFALALPLYLAFHSRWKAMLWSAVLGGFSQPLGAGIAALWFKLAGSTDMAPGERIYGCMFAVTSGIMTSVALSLFSESLDLTHSRGICMMFAFIGMGIMGVSSALTA